MHQVFLLLLAEGQKIKLLDHSRIWAAQIPEPGGDYHNMPSAGFFQDQNTGFNYEDIFTTFASLGTMIQRLSLCTMA